MQELSAKIIKSSFVKYIILLYMFINDFRSKSFVFKLGNKQ